VLKNYQKWTKKHQKSTFFEDFWPKIQILPSTDLLGGLLCMDLLFSCRLLNFRKHFRACQKRLVKLQVFAFRKKSSDQEEKSL